MEPLIYCYCRTSSKTCNSSETIDITDNAKFPQKLAIAMEPLIYCYCRTSSKTCNSYRNLDITATAGVPPKLAIAIETLILLLLQVFPKNLQ